MRRECSTHVKRGMHIRFWWDSQKDIHVGCGPCPHSMARPRVADGGTVSSYGG
jgi:hypothetical protein